MKLALEITDLSKSYGTKKAIRGIHFEVPAGTCFGLLGPNGAGKSTTMKIITGIIQSDTGTAKVAGEDIRLRNKKVLQKIGYVPQSITLYETLSAYDNLLFFGRMHGMSGKNLTQKIDDILQQVGLLERKMDKVSTYSGGMKRRINIAAALLHSPEIIILDEPTVGIDPQSRNHIFKMIQEMKKQGVTVIYSTHYMEEVETLCDQIAIIDHGEIIIEGSLQTIIQKYGRNTLYIEAEQVQKEQLTPFGEVTAVKQGFQIETETPLTTLQKIAAFCEEKGLNVHRLEIVLPSLESIFLQMTGSTLRDD